MIPSCICVGDYTFSIRKSELRNLSGFYMFDEDYKFITHKEVMHPIC